MLYNLIWHHLWTSHRTIPRLLTFFKMFSNLDNFVQSRVCFSARTPRSFTSQSHVAHLASRNLAPRDVAALPRDLAPRNRPPRNLATTSQPRTSQPKTCNFGGVLFYPGTHTKQACLTFFIFLVLSYFFSNKFSVKLSQTNKLKFS